MPEYTLTFARSARPLLKAADLEDREWDGVLITALEDLAGAERYLEEAGVAAPKVWELS